MRYPKVRTALVTASVLGLAAASPSFALTGGVATTTAAAGFGQATFAPQAVNTTRLTAAVQMTKDERAPTRG